jgi:hypothetical protein
MTLGRGLRVEPGPGCGNSLVRFLRWRGGIGVAGCWVMRVIEVVVGPPMRTALLLGLGLSVSPSS